MRRNRMIGLGSVAFVVVVVAALVVAKVTGGANPPTAASSSVSPAAGTPVPAALSSKLRSVPISTLVGAPTGEVSTSPQSISDPALSEAGKPDLLYVGAEFCPVCATERWALYVALSKFGTFSPQPGKIHSAVREGDIATVTFYGTKFTSPYLTFTPVEETTNQPEGDYYVALQKPTPVQQRLWESHAGETFPWIDFGGRMELSSAQFNPTLLEGRSFDSIVSQIGDNSTPVGAAVDASAKVLIASICGTMTTDKPADVCSAVGHV